MPLSRDLAKKGNGSKELLEEKKESKAEKAGAYVYNKGKVAFEYIAQKGHAISVERLLP